jgi:Trk-type K+ transport system membrane component
VKVLLVPLAIAAFVLFLLILGAIGFVVAFAVLAVFGRIWRLLSRSGRPQRS